MCPACLLFMRKKCDGFYVFIWKVSEDPFEPPPPLILPSHLLKTSLRKRGFHISMETHPLWGPCGVFCVQATQHLLCLSLATKTLNMRGRQQSVMIKHKRDEKIICEMHSLWHHCHFPVQPVPRGACLFWTASGSLSTVGCL